MSDTIDDGGPAFPCVGEGHGNPFYHTPGMTLLDWFAGQALALARVVEWRSEREIAEEAYGIARAMLAERKKGGAA